LSLPNTNRSLVAGGTVTQTNCRQTKQLGGSVADRVLITYAAIFLAVLVAVARYLP
jgi:hypothetical protein